MNLRIIFLLIILCLSFSVVISQNTLKDIVLTYDLNRRATPGNGLYDIDKPQLVHIEPICENQDSFGNFCAIMLDLNLDKNPYIATIKLVHQNSGYQYFTIDTAYICDNFTCAGIPGVESSDFVLVVALSRGSDKSMDTVEIKSKGFQVHLSGKRMDVYVPVEDPKCKAQKERMKDPKRSPPWVCRFVFR